MATIERPDIAMTTELNVAPWHPITNPECSNCRGLARPVRPKPKCKCKPIELRLSRLLATRKQLRDVVFRAELPKEELAAKILGMNPATLWRMLTGKSPISDSTASQLGAIEYIQRDGAHVHVIYNIGTPRPRWDSMVKKRRRNTLHMQRELQC